MSVDPQVLRMAVGPSPWAFANRSIKVAGVSYRFREFAPGDKKLSGLISIQDSKGRVLLILDFYCYARILEDGTTLLWRESGNIIFDCFLLSSLQPIADPFATAVSMREKKLGWAPLPASQHWEISPHLQAGSQFPLGIPHDWSHFEETLVLANHADSNGFDRMARAILVFDWLKRQVEVFPQDWFNNGSYDFGYQWITRVARRSDGKIVGDGIRLGSFELDASNRQIEKWTAQNPFYMLK